MFALRHQYLSKVDLRGFDHYRYNCQDTSPLSNYVMHPFWNQVIRICPLWIAPNLLTFVGFLCCVAHNLLPAVFDYNFRSGSADAAHPIPDWVWFTVSALLFFAHTLDGIDGKQARRTQTSSALGELFDHGCDSWSTLFITVTFYSVLGRDEDGFSIPIFRMYLVLWVVFFTFHVSHWEKYNTGVLYLPWSYDLAMVGGTIFYFLTGMFGYRAWKVYVWNGLTGAGLGEIVVYICCFCLSFPKSAFNVIQSYRQGSGKQPSVWEAIRPMTSFVIAAALCIVWAVLSPNDIIEIEPRCFYFMSGTLYANLSCRLIIMQMSGSRGDLFNKLLMPLGVSVVLALAMPNGSKTFEMTILYVLTTVVLLAHLHYVICVVRQMCEYLKIDCFKIRDMGQHRLISSNDDDDDDDDEKEEVEKEEQ